MQRFQILLGTLMGLMGLIGCTEAPKMRIIPEKTMHFPSVLSLQDNVLIVGAGSDDEEYNFGRLVALDTNKIKTGLLGSFKEPLPWSSVVLSNLMIPTGIGSIYQSGPLGKLVFASRQNSKIYAQTITNGLFACNVATLSIDKCKDAQSFQLSESEPFEVRLLKSDTSANVFAVGYLSSTKIDIIKVSSPDNSFTLVHSFDLVDLLKRVHQSSALNHARFMTRKMQLTTGKMHFLMQPHPEGLADPKRDVDNDVTLFSGKESSSLNSLGSFILSLPSGPLLTPSSLSDSDISYLDLHQKYDIFRSQDFFIEEKENAAYVLAKAPESLYKIDLSDRDKSLIETNLLCRGAASMTVVPSINSIYVPCYDDNLVAAYSTDGLHIVKSSQVQGRGPTQVVFDEKNGLIFVSFSDDGRVIIFDKDLKYLGYLFDKAPNNRVGSK